MRTDGLLLRDPDGEARLHIRTALTPTAVEWGDADVVVLATKTHQAEAALRSLPPVASARPIVCATNGLESERLALRRHGEVYGMSVMLPADHLTPGVVTAYSAPVTGVLDLGRYPDGVDDRAEAIAADLTTAGFSSRVDDDIMARKRQKLLMNLSNVLDAACVGGRDAGDETARLWSAARAEAIACFNAAGLRFISDEDDAARRKESGLQMRAVAGARRGGGSTWQSLARRTGNTEVDYLNGEVVLLGRLHGVATPVNEVLQALARELAESGAGPGTVDPVTIRARLPG